MTKFPPESFPEAAGPAAPVFRRGHALLLGIALVCIAIGLAGCGRTESAVASTAPPVRVAAAEAREITDWDTFTGRFEAVETVKLRPRVSGYIEQVHFDEGKQVQRGELLFTIDQRPYRVELQRAQAELARAEAQTALSRTELARAEKLLAVRAVSQEEYDQRASRKLQLEAEVQAARAAVAAARLDLEFTEVVAPIAGRVSRAEVTAGNYVTAGATMLTSVVSLDPIYVYFDSDEQTYLKYNALARSGELPSARDNPNPVFVGLANDEDFPHPGRMDFLDNALNPQTGTIRARALLANPDQAFIPGMLARIRVLGSGKYTATLIDGAAVATNQDQKYVVVVNEQNVAEYRTVELGDTVDGRRVVRSGLAAGERVVIGGLQRIRPGMTVDPQAVESGKQVATTTR